MLYFLSPITLGIAVFLIAVSWFSLKQLRRRMLDDMETFRPQRPTSLLLMRLESASNSLLRPVYNLPYFKRFQMQAEALKVNLHISYLILLKLAFTVIAGAAVFFLASSSSYALLAAVVAFFIPDIVWIKKLRAKREAIRKVFPETIDLLDLCIGAGLDLRTSIQWVIDKTDSNAFVEQLEIVLSEMRVGKGASQALKDMGKRLNISDVNSFVRCVVLSERMGTSLEETFRNLSEDTRLMRFQAGERYAIQASIKILFPLLFCILPVIMIVVAGPIIVKFMVGGIFPTGGGF
jgi:pilus assembly protein TadC